MNQNLQDLEYSKIVFISNLLEKFKTQKCRDRDCPVYQKFKKDKDVKDLNLLIQCEKYHNRQDFRRGAITHKYSTEEQCVDQQNCDSFQDIYEGLAPKFKCSKYHNVMELRYHPSQFKRKLCLKKKDCKNNQFICPDYHGSDEQRLIEKFLQAIQNKKFLQQLKEQSLRSDSQNSSQQQQFNLSEEISSIKKDSEPMIENSNTFSESDSRQIFQDESMRQQELTFNPGQMQQDATFNPSNNLLDQSQSLTQQSQILAGLDQSSIMMLNQSTVQQVCMNCDGLNEKLTKYKERYSQKKDIIQELEEDNDKLQKTKEDNKKKINKLNALIIEYDDEKIVTSKKIKNLTKEIASLEEQIEGLKKSNQDLLSENDQLKEKNTSFYSTYIENQENDRKKMVEHFENLNKKMDQISRISTQPNTDQSVLDETQMSIVSSETNKKKEEKKKQKKEKPRLIKFRPFLIRIRIRA